MRTLIYATFIAALANRSFCSPARQPSEDAATSAASGYFPVVGLQGHGVQPRLEIRTMQQEQPYAFNLMLLALARMKAMPESERLSYFQIGGIHGMLNVPWDSVEQTAGGIGYCNHYMVLFPTWHRPYVVLHEMAFSAAAKTIAAQFTGTDRTKYMAIAETIRWPYWDWAIDPPSGQNNIPTCLVDEQVTLNTPTGYQTIANPLYDFNFHPLGNAFNPYSPWDQWKHTLRWPDSTAKNAVTHEEDLIENCNSNQPNLKALVYYMFTQLSPTWPQFSNAGAGGNGANSIEAIHNIVHGMAGGLGSGNADGHMAVQYFAALDPSFMLHHAQVDRLLAMWQTLNPNVWVTPEETTSSTFVIAANTTVDSTTPLKPFHSNAGGSFWTSDSVRQWTEFGYTYPDFVQSKGSVSTLKQIINSKYGPNGQGHAAKRGLLSSADPQYEYIAHIETSRTALNGSYGIYLFLGVPPASPSEWASASNLMGTNYILANPGQTVPGPASLVEGSVIMTGKIVEFFNTGNLDSLLVPAVSQLLQANLQWRIARNGVEFDPASVSGFKVSVVAISYTPPASDDEFPVWGSEISLSNVTDGKAGGAGLLTSLL